ncbi:class C sortase [Anaerosphaera multitolerans]|uniref:Class C sortase n=1 Tax=Anaerosphaera multitolerans TaxID=2487351 RepID=A0A437S619_9FIRM|nr:class C sortase [Anaerosphaera multitolerans]RVU54444.1 class C sortase [Anaerosphaera multitolerans]
MKIKKSTIIAFIFLIIGISLLLYPTISNWWNSMHQTIAVGSYMEKTNNNTEKENEAIIQEAKKYNEGLISKSLDRFKLNYEELNEYNSLLNVIGTNIMSIIEIPKLNIRMPIYHGTDEAVLQIAIGHIPGTSLPIGGKGTHSVISGHTGLPSAKLFTDIEKLVNGDIFTLTTLGNTLTYEVDQIKIVLPSELDELRIEQDKDYVTLQTCTPYGINTHRLLVRGTRINTSLSNIKIVPDAIKVSSLLINCIVILLFIGILLLIKLIIITFKKIIKSNKSDL